MFDSMKTAYDRIAPKFPPNVRIGIDLEAGYGRDLRTPEATLKEKFSLCARTPGPDGRYFFEENICLDEIDDAAEALLRQIRRAEKAQPRRVVNQVA